MNIVGYLVCEEFDGYPEEVILNKKENEALDHLWKKYGRWAINWCDDEGVFWGTKDISENYRNTLLSYNTYHYLCPIYEDGSIGQSIDHTYRVDFILPYRIGMVRHNESVYE